MTDDDILAAARKAYREMGVKPAVCMWGELHPPQGCITAAGMVGLTGSVFDGIRSSTGADAQRDFVRSSLWMAGVMDSWDLVAKNRDHEDYHSGYAFGLRCRAEFADLLGGKP